MSSPSGGVGSVQQPVTSTHVSAPTLQGTYKGKTASVVSNSVKQLPQGKGSEAPKKGLFERKVSVEVNKAMPSVKSAKMMKAIGFENEKAMPDGSVKTWVGLKADRTWHKGRQRETREGFENFSDARMMDKNVKSMQNFVEDLGSFLKGKGSFRIGGKKYKAEDLRNYQEKALKEVVQKVTSSLNKLGFQDYLDYKRSGEQITHLKEDLNASRHQVKADIEVMAEEAVLKLTEGLDLGKDYSEKNISRAKRRISDDINGLSKDISSKKGAIRKKKVSAFLKGLCSFGIWGKQDTKDMRTLQEQCNNMTIEVRNKRNDLIRLSNARDQIKQIEKNKLVAQKQANEIK